MSSEGAFTRNWLNRFGIWAPVSGGSYSQFRETLLADWWSMIVE